MSLIYEIDDLAENGALSSGPLRVAWNALTAIDPVRQLLERIEVREREIDSMRGPADVERKDSSSG